jgi:hypothetical protein
MPIPNADSAFVPPEKINDYLLNEHHPVSGSKARWFLAIGYDPANPSILERDLLRLVRTSADYSEVNTSFGTKYVVSGRITAPNGTDVTLVTIWIVETGDERPRLVTAYPGEST